MKNNYLSGLFWLVISAIVIAWLGPWSTPLTIFWEIIVILFVITVVFCCCKRLSVPVVTLVNGTDGLPPAPRDAAEAQVRQLGFIYLGDFDVKIMPTTSTRIRAYIGPDRQSAALLIDMTSGQEKTSILEFCTNLHPSGGITTSTASNPGIFPRPLDRMQAHVPWKKTAGEVFELHQSLCRTALVENFTAKTVHSAGFAEKIVDDTRKDYEYQVQTGRLSMVAEGQYRLTLLETMIAAPLLWYQMVYGHLFTWFSLPDAFFCWKFRRRLRRFKQKSHGRDKKTVADRVAQFGKAVKTRFCFEPANGLNPLAFARLCITFKASLVLMLERERESIKIISPSLSFLESTEKRACARIFLEIFLL